MTYIETVVETLGKEIEMQKFQIDRLNEKIELLKGELAASKNFNLVSEILYKE